MDANDIINALNRVLDLGDQLDNAGGGVQGLTNGEHTTREVCKIELGQFLLYLASSSTFINDGQAAVLNLVLGDGFSEIPAYKFKELASTISAPDPSNNLSLSAFMQADMALSQQNGESSSSLTSILISIYKAFGQLLIAVNENALAHSRYDRFVSRLESRAALVGYSSDDSDSSSGDFDIDDDVLTQYTGDDTHVSVPDGITRIGDNAFSGKTEIQTITLPDSVTVIGESAFRHCDSLERINLPEGITEIESDAFTYCDSLTSIEIPSTVDTIGGDAFLFCNHIKRIRIPSTLTDIGDDAFKYCSGLETVIVYGGRRSSAALDAMKEHFSDDVKVIWEGDEQATTKKEHSSRKTSNTSSKTTSTGTAKKTTSSSSKKATTSTSSGKKASSTAKSSSRYIGNSAFSGCVKLAKINIPEGVSHINPFTFNGCKALTSITLPESVTWIGMYAFCDCIKLASINLHEYITQIFMGAFQNCAALTKIELPVGLAEINSNLFDGCKKLETVVIPETVTSIGANAFDGCKKLKGIVIPSTVDEIGRFAFNECQALTEMVIPEGVETLDDLTFSDCSGLTAVTLPSSLTSIKDFVFDGCKNLKRIIIPASVETIGDGAFGSCEKLTEIVLPDGLTEIKDNLLKDCTGLKKITIPNSVTSIGTCAFSGCANLTTINIPVTVTSLGDGAFMGCSHLTSLTLPQGINAIADSLCDGCSSLKKITIPDSVETIGDQAFNACAALTEVSIPDGVKAIGSFAFDDCTALKSASLPGGVELGTWAFPDEVDVTYRLGNGRTTKRKPDSTSSSSSTPSPQTASSKKTVGKYTAVMPSDELYSHYGKLKREADKFKGMGVRFVQNNGEEFQALDIIEILENNGHKSTNVYRKLKAAMSANSYDLDDLALKMSQVFRVNESVFNSRHDDEGDIHERLMDKKWKLSALRSFAWTLADLADREGKSIDDYDYDDLVALCGFIEEREWLNYEEGSWFDGLCGHPDIHVFYMPGKMIENDEADEICNVLKFNPITSLDAFRSDLKQLSNAMIKLHNGILKSRDRNEKLDTPASAVLQAWCVMAMSAKIAFFSEDGPMFFFHSYPSDSLNTKALSVGTKAASMKKTAPKQKKTEASTGMESAANYEIIRGADGRERIKLGEYPIGSPITWLVLEKKGQELLLLSEFALDAKPFCEASFSVESTNEWHGCTLRTWLNGDFYTEAFSDSERSMILDDTHDTYKKSASGEEETPSATDKVFLLSAREVNKYFPQERDRICKASAYAKEHGAEIEAGPNQCSWWLRSPAVAMMGLSSWAPSIRADGSGKGWGIYSGETCVRPVIRVKSSKFTAGSTTTVTSASETKASSTTTKRKRTQAQKLSELEETVNTAASELEQASDRPLTAEEQNALQEAQGILANMQSQMSSTTSALETHKENLRKQEEEKQRRIEGAKKKGKSSHDEVDMLAVLLIEEALGQLYRDEDRFAEIYAEDFGAYDAKQLIRLRKKVMPTIHDAGVIESAKSDMLARTVEERFSISTGNYFNVSTDWDFDAKGTDAIEATKLWYKPEELPELRKRMEEHKEKTRQSVSSQLTAFRPEWSDFRGIRSDLHINISTDSEPVPEAHNLFHVKMGRDLDVRISITNPALGYISIPVMNVFASCWKVSPEDIWNAALQNSIEDSRGQSSSSRSDAMAAKAKALSQIKTRPSTNQSAATSTSTAPRSTNTQSQLNANAQTNPNAKRIKELEESIAALRREADSIGGLFGFVKRNKIKKEIEAQQRELDSLKRRM